MPQRYLIADIETRIDTALINATQFRGLDLTDELAYARYRDRLLNQSLGRSDFIPAIYHRPISIAVGPVGPAHELVDVYTLPLSDPSVQTSFFDGTLDEVATGRRQREHDMVEAFWTRVNAGYTLVTFNGRSFDLPVLELAALREGCAAATYWNDKYGARYRYSEDGHYDLADVLSNGGAYPLVGGLNALCQMLGLAGKGQVDGSQVQGMYEAGRLTEIDAYSKRDVVLTYQLWLRLELIRGRLTPTQYAAALTASAVCLNRAAEDL